MLCAHTHTQPHRSPDKRRHSRSIVHFALKRCISRGSKNDSHQKKEVSPPFFFSSPFFFSWFFSQVRRKPSLADSHSRRYCWVGGVNWTFPPTGRRLDLKRQVPTFSAPQVVLFSGIGQPKNLVKLEKRKSLLKVFLSKWHIHTHCETKRNKATPPKTKMADLICIDFGKKRKEKILEVWRPCTWNNEEKEREPN